MDRRLYSSNDLRGDYILYLAFLGLDTVQELFITLIDHVMTMNCFTILDYAFQNSVRAYVVVWNRYILNS